MYADSLQKIMDHYPSAVLIKQGGQKAVYKIAHPQYGDAVLKIGETSSEHQLERIRREVETLKDIVSPYYPRNYSFDVVSGNQFVIIEEYLAAPPLSERLSEFTDLKSSLSLLDKLIDGLRVLWDRRIVHRDLKPDNILVFEDGTP